MRPLRDLLATWENWSARDTLARAPVRVGTNDAREALRRSLDEAPEVDPLDALRDTAELMALLTAWRWLAMQAAHTSGATWKQIGAAAGLDPQQAESECACVADRRAATLPAPSGNANR